jgi:hypothetical protein
MKSLPGAVALALLTVACNPVAQPSIEQRRANAPAGPGSSTAANAGWPNAPPDLSALTDQPWTVLTGGGWNRRPSANDRIVNDATAPGVPSTALEYVYPAGFAGGTAPATHYFELGHRKELFVGLLWKVSIPWQGHASGVNKIQFVYAESSDVAMVMYGGPAGPYELRVMPQWPEHDGSWLTPNIAHPPPVPGQWHRVEWYLKYESSAGAGDGVIRWWLDGALAGDYTNVRYPHDAGFIEYQISPTWGGVGDVKRETDSYRFNRSYISSR